MLPIEAHNKNKTILTYYAYNMRYIRKCIDVYLVAEKVEGGRRLSRIAIDARHCGLHGTDHNTKLNHHHDKGPLATLYDLTDF